MEIEAALTREQGVTFVVTPVKRHALSNSAQREQYRRAISAHFDEAPVVLVSEDGDKLHGRTDIVRFLSNVPLEALPWRKWRLSSAS